MNKGDIIFLSASVPYRKGWLENVKPSEIEEAIVSVARGVFARNGRLLFGGHPSVSPLIAAVAGEYFAADPARRIRPIVTFQSRFFEGKLPDETTEMVRMGWSAIEWTPAVLGKSPDDPGPSLSLMRDRMLLGEGDVFKKHELKPPCAMIGIGGMEGIRDEALLFLAKRRAWHVTTRPQIYLFKSGGGAAARLLEPNSKPEYLWPGRQPNYDLHKALMMSVAERDILGVEDIWRERHPDFLPRQTPFQPYAAMSQWLLDSLSPKPTK